LPATLALATSVRLPASPSLDDPVRTSMLPLAPGDDVDPVPTRMSPDWAVADGDIIEISPLVLAFPSPLVIAIAPPLPPLPADMETSPPGAASEADEPAAIVRRPPSPVVLSPLVIDTSLPEPLPLDPTDTVMLPP